MNIKALFEAQLERNSVIVIDDNLNSYKLSARKHLELHVKLSDLAEETKCYKYWIDDNNDLDKSVIMKKYLVCFAQIITMGLDCKYDDISEITIKPNDYCLSDQFLNLFIDINDLIISPSKDHFFTLLEDYISLGITLGISECKIKDYFINKY